MTYSDRPFLGHHLLERHGDDHQEEEDHQEEDEEDQMSRNCHSSLYSAGINLQKLVWIKTLMLVVFSGDNVKLERGLLLLMLLMLLLLLLLFRNSSILCKSLLLMAFPIMLARSLWNLFSNKLRLENFVSIIICASLSNVHDWVSLLCIIVVYHYCPSLCIKARCWCLLLLPPGQRLEFRATQPDFYLNFTKQADMDQKT